MPLTLAHQLQHRKSVVCLTDPLAVVLIVTSGLVLQVGVPGFVVMVEASVS